jgi:hypothetical protein
MNTSSGRPLCVLGIVLSLAARPAAGAEPSSSGMLSPDQIACHILRATRAPDVERADPLEDSVWQQAETVGPFFSKGRPEEPSRATTVRMLCSQGHLYIAAQCLDPQIDRIKTGSDIDKIWQDDSLEFVFTQGTTDPYPYTHLEVNAAGLSAAAHVLQPFALGIGPLKQAIDPATARVRTGKDSKGWWALVVLPLEQLRIEGTAFQGNMIRNRPADGTDYAWCDLWAGSVYNLRRLQPMTIVNTLPPARPRLQAPVGLAMGENQLHWQNWSADCTMLVNDKPVPVQTGGNCLVRIDRRGTASIRVVTADSTSLIAYSTEVPRALLIEAAEPFQQDARKPVLVKVTLNTAAAAPVEVTLIALQDARQIGRQVVSLANGTHEVELACKTDMPGEVSIIATADVPAVLAGPVALRAEHWCVLGQTREQFDKFRDGIVALPTVSLYRASLADACNYYHLLQAGNGQYRSLGRTGTLRTDEWSYSFVYAFALLYTADWPENPYRNDKRMLASAIAGMEAGLAPETWNEWMKHPPNRQLQSYLLTYDLLKDKVPAELAEYWRDRLIRMMDGVIDRWIQPARQRLSFYSEDVGTGTNHFAYHLANVYTAGKIFARQDWLDLGRTMMRRLAGHERDGFFPEQRLAVVMHYTWLSSNAVGQYYWQSGDEEVLPHLERCADFAWRTALPDNQVVILHDSRNNEARAWMYGDFVLSLTPQGRWLAHARMQQAVTNQKPSRQSPEFWFRTAENAMYFRAGEEKAPPAAYEYAFLDGRAVVARAKGFTYGLSAICTPATDETYRVDQQNAIELDHEQAGRLLSGANSQTQPEAGSFYRKLKDRTVFLPREGAIERIANGHSARLVFDTFEAQVTCEILSPRSARIVVQLLKAQGDEPVTYNFFPVAEGAADLKAEGPIDLLQMTGVRIRCSQPVQIKREFKIMDPYGLKLTVHSKPLRAFTTLRIDKPLILDVAVGESARPATLPAR